MNVWMNKWYLESLSILTGITCACLFAVAIVFVLQKLQLQIAIANFPVQFLFTILLNSHYTHTHTHTHTIFRCRCRCCCCCCSINCLLKMLTNKISANLKWFFTQCLGSFSIRQQLKKPQFKSSCLYTHTLAHIVLTIFYYYSFISFL